MQAPGVSPVPAQSGYGRPQLIFFCELGGRELLDLLSGQSIALELAEQGYGLALATRELDEATAAAVRLLNQHGVPVVAWLLLDDDEGLWLNLQNYPQAIERYRAFLAWARAQGLGFQAIGLDIEPPAVEIDRLQRWGPREAARRLWLARENVLYPAARAAYADLIAEIHHDGYEVHAYQLPILADDRRASTTLAQRALDIVDLPADLEVLICYSSVPFDRIRNDLGGALITSYGPSADSIAVGSVGGGRDQGDDLPPLAWDALERDLLLAAQHTDTIYVYSLEGCIQRGLLSRIAAINWAGEARPVAWKRAALAFARAALALLLLGARFGPSLIAWLGWALALALLVQQLRSLRRPTMSPEPS